MKTRILSLLLVAFLAVGGISSCAHTPRNYSCDPRQDSMYTGTAHSETYPANQTDPLTTQSSNSDTEPAGSSSGGNTIDPPPPSTAWRTSPASSPIR